MKLLLNTNIIGSIKACKKSILLVNNALIDSLSRNSGVLVWNVRRDLNSVSPPHFSISGL